MLKRAWLLFAALWAGVFLWSGSTRLSGVQEIDLLFAVAPLVLGWLLVLATRFVVTGSPMRPPHGPAPYRRP